MENYPSFILGIIGIFASPVVKFDIDKMRAKRRYVSLLSGKPVVEKGMVSPQAGRARRYTFFHYRASPFIVI